MYEGININEVEEDGGYQECWIGFECTQNGNTHTFAWKFTPFNQGPEDARFDIGFLHKKYMEGVEKEPTYAAEEREEGVEVIESIGFLESSVNPQSVPEQVKNTVADLFGDPLANRTFSSDEGVDVGWNNYPNDIDIKVYNIEFMIKASYTQRLDEDDPEVQDGSYKRVIKFNGEESVYYEKEHMLVAWVKPVSDSEKPLLEIEKFLHKTWDRRVTVNFEETHENEKILIGAEKQEDCPDFDELPPAIIKEISEWFGLELANSTIREAGGFLPLYYYHCLDCGLVAESHPRQYCPDCNSNGFSRINREDLPEYTDLENVERILSNKIE